MKKLFVMESQDLTYSMIRAGITDEKKQIALESVSEYVREKYKDLIAYDDIRTLDDSIREITKHKPDVVIDDYIQLIESGLKNKDRRFEIEKIVNDYKWICKQENCSGLLVSQLNRDIEKRFDPRPRSKRRTSKVRSTKGQYDTVFSEQVESPKSASAVKHCS